MLVLCLLPAAPSLFAGGGRDPELSLADDYIKDKRYDEAIQILTAFAGKNPGRFDEAQRRFRRIIEIRSRYHDYAGELLDTLVNDPENAEKILSLSRELEGLESTQNTAARQFLTRTRDLALFAHNRDRLEAILAEGRRLMDQGNYTGAFDAYAGGLDIYQAEFFAAGYGEGPENRVRESLRIIGEEAAAFSSLTAPLNAALASMEQLNRRGTPPLSQVQDLYRRAGPSLDRLISLRNTLEETGDFWEELLASLQESDPGLGDRSFLSFASRLLRGRSWGVREGMIGAAEGFWKSLMPRMETAAAGMAGRFYGAALTALAEGDYREARSRLALAAEYLAFPRDMVDRWNLFYRLSGEDFQTIFDQPVLAEKAGDYLKYEALGRLVPRLDEAGIIGLEYGEFLEGDFSSLESWRSGLLPAAAAGEREGEYRRFLDGLSGRVQTLGAALASETAEFRLREERAGGRDTESAGPGSLFYLDEAAALVRKLDAGIAGQLRNSAVRQYSIANGEFEKRVLAREAELYLGNARLTGLAQISGEDVEYGPRFPAEALEVLGEMAESLAGDAGAGRALLDRYAGEPSPLREELAPLRLAARELSERLGALGDRGAALSAQARGQTAQAESLRLDGDRLYREAQDALGRNNFETARDRVLRASERYNASLEIQESAVLRREWDTRLMTLGAEIKRAENESIVREVRALVNNARNTYFTGNFERAEELLVRARNLWLAANAEDDPEVSYWLTVIRGALSLRSGRVIPVTAPLYAEMSQLLSDARKNYDEGLRNFNANRREEGLASFAAARRKTREVKLMFPVNQEAGILELRMDLVVDPQAFNESFARRFSEAVAGTKPGRRSLEAFADLQNLAEINPRYPGIRNAVLQAEIDMGYRLPPPDPRALARSRELAAEARAIIDANLRSQFPVALEQLNQALQMDPNNTQAMYEKDRVQTLLGSEGNIVLDSAAEQEYQRAVRELQQRNTLTALSIVQQLLRDPKNRNSPRILELQRRIELAL